VADQGKLNNLLVRASEDGHTETVTLLLDAGADVHAKKDLALCLASEKNHTEIVGLLLDAGANVHADNDYALLV
jgi:ankyrin repeat protein